VGSARLQLLLGNFCRSSCSVSYKLIYKRSQTRQIDSRCRFDQTFSCSPNAVMLSLNATDLFEFIFTADIPRRLCANFVQGKCILTSFSKRAREKIFCKIINFIFNFYYYNEYLIWLAIKRNSIFQLFLICETVTSCTESTVQGKPLVVIVVSV